jgi:hypothetical protein
MRAQTERKSMWFVLCVIFAVYLGTKPFTYKISLRFKELRYFKL